MCASENNGMKDVTNVNFLLFILTEPNKFGIIAIQRTSIAFDGSYTDAYGCIWLHTDA